MVISSRVVACTSQPVAFNGHPSTRGCLIGLRNKPQQKQTCQHLAVVYWQLVSLLMELSIDGEKCSLTCMVCVSGGFWQSRSHLYILTINVILSLAWPDRFLLFFFGVAEKGSGLVYSRYARGVGHLAKSRYFKFC